MDVFPTGPRHAPRALLLGAALLAVAVPSPAAPPDIRKPRPVPTVPTPMGRPSTAEFDDTLAIGGEDVDAKKVSSRLTVDVHVNGQGPYKFVVDSGADTSVVGLRIARRLELPLDTPIVLHSFTSSDIVDRVRVAELRVGPSRITDLALPALAESDVGGDGMIGIDALVRQRLMMDFDQKLIKVEDARTKATTVNGDIVVVAQRRRGQLILTQVRAAGVGLEAVIDTGSEITVGNSALRDKLLRRNRKSSLTEVTAYGVTGEPLKLQMALISELSVGPILLRDVPIAFADLPPFKVFDMDKTPALLIGTDLLEQFRRVSLDFRARKVRFQLRSCAPGAVTLRTAAVLTRIATTGSRESCGR